MRAAIGLLLAAALIACSHPQAKAPAQIATASAIPGTEIDVGYGIRCVANFDTSHMLHAAPITYAAADAGKPGVQKLTRSERTILRRIQHYVKSDTLRIGWVDEASTPRHFIVFDASGGPCVIGTHAYHVLNGTCNEFYGPADNPYGTEPAPDCFNTTPPWMTPSPRP